MRVRDVIAVWVAMLAFVPMLVAQEETPAQDQPAQAAPAEADQPDRAQPAQTQPERAQPDQTNRDRAQSAQTEETAVAASPAEKKLDSHMAKCLNTCNHAEIELGKMALDKSQNQQVRQLAQKIIDDHTSAQKDLKRFISEDATTVADAAAEHQGLAEDAKTMDKLEKQIAKNELAMTKDVLMRYEGQDFDMGFLGQQIVAHTQMLAKLHAMKDHGSQAFQVSVSTLLGTAEDHFRDAVRISRALQNREDSPTSVDTSANGTTPQPRTVNRPIAGQQPAATPEEPKNQDRVGNPQNE